MEGVFCLPLSLCHSPLFLPSPPHTPVTPWPLRLFFFFSRRRFSFPSLLKPHPFLLLRLPHFSTSFWSSIIPHSPFFTIFFFFDHHPHPPLHRSFLFLLFVLNAAFLNFFGSLTPSHLCSTAQIISTRAMTTTTDPSITTHAAITIPEDSSKTLPVAVTDTNINTKPSSSLEDVNPQFRPSPNADEDFEGTTHSTLFSSRRKRTRNKQERRNRLD